MAQTCKDKPKDCRSLKGAVKDSCLIWNGNIEHACNVAAQNEDVNLGGCGPVCQADKAKNKGAGSKQ